MKTWQFQAISNVPVFEFLPKLSQSFPHLVTLVLIHHEKDGSQMRGNSVVSQCLWVLSINVSMIVNAYIYNIPKKNTQSNMASWEIPYKWPAIVMGKSWENLHRHPDPRARAMSSRLGACGAAMAGSYGWSFWGGWGHQTSKLATCLVSELSVFERQVAIREGGLCGYAAKKVGGPQLFVGEASKNKNVLGKNSES